MKYIETHIKSLRILVALIAILTCIPACENEAHNPEHQDPPKQIFILYSLGFNNLSSYLSEDIEDLKDSYASINGSNAVIVFSHKTKSPGDYSTPNSPVIIELSKDKNGVVREKTLLVMDENTVGTSGETLNEVLTFIKDKYKDAEYSILFSSHGTGWTPADYCNDPNKYEADLWGSDIFMQKMSRMDQTPYWGVIPEHGGPVVKSFGVQNITKNTYHEMNITDMAQAFPMKMKSIIFDACFMGGVEVAYEFRNVTDLLIASQTEILADGMDYESMMSYVFDGKESLKEFCKNFFNYYNRQTGDYQSATISLIDCSKLEPLAEVCCEIFTSNRKALGKLESSTTVQRYFRPRYSYNHKWFYDLEDIAMHCDISKEQEERLKAALNECVIYKAATFQFMNEITIYTHCGLSMYLPYTSYKYLNDFYKELEWNKVTKLVQ